MNEENISTLDEFNKVAGKIHSLVDNHKCNINIRYPFFSDFTLENKEILDKEERYILAREIEPLLSFLLSDGKNEDRVLRSFLPFEDDLLTPDILKIFRQKIDIVKNFFYSDDLFNHAKIRKNTKHSILDNISWEINRKIKTGDSKNAENIKYITIKMSFEEPDDRIPPFFYKRIFSPYTNNQKVTFDCHIKDIEELIKTLSEIKNSFNDLD